MFSHHSLQGITMSIGFLVHNSLYDSPETHPTLFSFKSMIQPFIYNSHFMLRSKVVFIIITSGPSLQTDAFPFLYSVLRTWHKLHFYFHYFPVGSNSMMTSEPPASEWKREESWEDILENMNNAASLNLKGTVKSGGEETCLFGSLNTSSSEVKRVYDINDVKCWQKYHKLFIFWPIMFILIIPLYSCLFRKPPYPLELQECDPKRPSTLPSTFPLIHYL